MVSPFMAFAKGAFQGYNEMQAEKRAFDYEMLLQDKKNEAKKQIESPPMFSVLGAGGKKIEYFELPDSKMYDTEKMYWDEFTRRYHTDIRLGNKDYLENLEKIDPLAYNNLRNEYDNMAYTWLEQHQPKTPTSSGRMLLVTGDANVFQRSHPWGERFLDIAMQRIPRGDQEQMINDFIDSDGNQWLQSNDFNAKEWGVKSYRDLISHIIEIKSNKIDADRSIRYYLNNYGAKNFRVYENLKPTLDIIRQNKGYLRQQNIDMIQETLKANADFKVTDVDRVYTEEEIIDLPWDLKALQELFSIASPTVHDQKSGAYVNMRILDPKEFATDVLQLGNQGIETYRPRWEASIDAVNHIDQLLELLDTNQIWTEEEIEKGHAPPGTTVGTYKGSKRKNIYGAVAVGFKLFEGLFGEGGAFDQVKSILGRYGLTYTGPGGIDGAIDRLKSRVTTGTNISRRDVLTELLAYQIAAAIQGGTGGRTISDKDVLIIKKALGATVFTTDGIQKARLLQVRRMMTDMGKVAELYVHAPDIETLKSAHMTSQFAFGVGLRKVSTSWAATYIEGLGSEGNRNYIPSEEQIETDKKELSVETYNIPANSKYEFTSGKQMVGSDLFKSKDEETQKDWVDQFNAIANDEDQIIWQDGKWVLKKNTNEGTPGNPNPAELIQE